MLNNNELKIIILDIDGTMIGNINSQVAYYDINNRLKKNKITCKFSFIEFCKELKHGLIRPGLDKFIKYIKLHYKNTFFFIYTASETKWAQFLIKKIEDIHDLKFERPLFTRKDCVYRNGSRMKSLEKIKQRIMNCVKKKGYIISSNYFYNNVMLIDNNNVLGKEEKYALLKCPTYDYEFYKDPTETIELSSLLSIKDIIEHYSNEQIIPYPTYKYTQGKYNNYFLYMSEKAKWLSKRYKMAYKKNKHFLKDTYWIVLLEIIQKLNKLPVDPKSIHRLNKIMSK